MSDTFDVAAAFERLARDRHDHAEVFRAPDGSLSLSVARWPAGDVDDQVPHTEDEVYHVTAGRAVLVVGGERWEVGPGSVAFVGAGAEHRFVDIAEDLETLVFWSPARHTNARR